MVKVLGWLVLACAVFVFDSLLVWAVVQAGGVQGGGLEYMLCR
jgi:hypothetical protein